MSVEFNLPELGENIESIQVTRVLVTPGDAVVVDQPVLELETDKATIEVPSAVAGTVSDIHVSEGDDVTVGQLILTVDNGGAAPVETPAPEAAAPAEETTKEAPAPVASEPPAPTSAAGGEFVLPALGENIESIQVTKVMVATGDAVAIDQPVLELETDKATIEVPSSLAGTVNQVHVAEGDEITVGQLILSLEGGASTAPVAAASAKPAPVPEPAAAPVAKDPEKSVVEKQESEGQPAVFTSSVQVPAAPSVRRFAREIGVDIGKVPGSGPNSRVSIEDVKRYAREINMKREVAAGAGPQGVPIFELPDFSKWGDVDLEKMSAIRRKTAEHMALSWQHVPHVTIHDKVDITELEPLRKKFAVRAEALGGKLTMAVMVCKVVASALKAFPKFNASIDMQNHRTIYKKYVNLGVAVSTERGLMVPVIQEADQKNMVELAAEISNIAKKARTGKIEMADLQGGTFTVTNLGRVGGSYFTPIINYPEVAILGMGRTVLEAAPDEDMGHARLMLPLSLSFDHRLIDGAEAAQFMGWVAEAIREPLILALEG